MVFSITILLIAVVVFLASNKYSVKSSVLSLEPDREQVNPITQIEDYPQLETALQQIQPIVVKDRISFMEKYQSLTGMLTVGLMFCVYTVNNKIIVALTGTALVALMVWSFIKIRSSKNVDSKTKQGVWWVILVLASVIAVMVFKLTGLVDMQKH